MSEANHAVTSFKESSPYQRKAALERIDQLRSQAIEKAHWAGIFLPIGTLAQAATPFALTALQHAGFDTFFLSTVGVSLECDALYAFLMGREKLTQSRAMNDEANSLDTSYTEGLKEANMPRWKERTLKRIDELKDYSKKQLLTVGVAVGSGIVGASMFGEAVYKLLNSPLPVDQALLVGQAALTFAFLTTQLMYEAAPLFEQRRANLSLVKSLDRIVNKPADK